MPSSARTLECAGLTRSFGARQPLAGVDLQARPGTVTALLGSNGAGKTTLMKILATLLCPTSGRASLCGHDVAADPAKVRRCMGFVPSEERSFHWRLSVRQNLAFFGSLYGLSPRVIAERTEGLLDTLHLLDRADTRFGELSTGMKQCLGIIRGLLHAPQVLLLDEPTRSLSPDMARRVTLLLRDLAEGQGRTILFATHNLLEAEAVAHAVAILHRGRIQAAGAPGELCAERGLPNLEALFHALTGDAP
jgi:ABC-type multidrug transport system ATPase subunit